MNEAYFKSLKAKDKLAAKLIKMGGISIIICVVSMLFLIAKETFPLFYPSQTTLKSSYSLPSNIKGHEIKYIGLDEYLHSYFTVNQNGQLSFFNLKDGHRLKEKFKIVAPDGSNIIDKIEKIDRYIYHILWGNGSSTLEEIKVTTEFDNDNNLIYIPFLKRSKTSLLDKEYQNFNDLKLKISSEGNITKVLLSKKQKVYLFKASSEGFLDDEDEDNEPENLNIIEIPTTLSGRISGFTFSKMGDNLVLVSSKGEIESWDISDIEEVSLSLREKIYDDRSITSIQMVYGDSSFVLGDSKGEVTTWTIYNDEKADKKVAGRIHDIIKHETKVKKVLSSFYNKSIISIDEDNNIELSYTTSERNLHSIQSANSLLVYSLSERNNGFIYLDEKKNIKIYELISYHPEVSIKVLFGKLWYEGYSEALYVWQSSSGSDDYEPKFSIIPLIFGTLKGTFYAMLFSIPIALFGALYTSQFLNNGIKNTVKSSIEVMSAVPSVIVGFVAALWFAPLLEETILSLIMFFFVLPLFTVFFLLLWSLLKSISSLKIPEGRELFFMIPIFCIALYFTGSSYNWLEIEFFNGDFKLWLYEISGLKYDQRNSIIISFALGFAIIPIIFTVSEDSFSNVPYHLKAASLALGASNWQTVWRVIIPSASPGIFAGVILGFGRAIGETMIVLMATGNTPILDNSILNGMRTLSANIAVEIPEAPVGGTLYRLLFLTSVLLFFMTFILNTLAEVVRQNLRKKYGQY